MWRWLYWLTLHFNDISMRRLRLIVCILDAIILKGFVDAIKFWIELMFTTGKIEDI